MVLSPKTLYPFICMWVLVLAVFASAQEKLDVRSDGNQVIFAAGDQPLLTYYLGDARGAIKRPFFAHIHTLSGTPVTRNYPPGPRDRSDHADMHPGLWLAFGDISGVDFWRNQGTVQHVKFTRAPAAHSNSHGGFTQLKHYLTPQGVLLCEEAFNLRVHLRAHCYLLEFDTSFTGPRAFTFGDQEEMGLGVRVATPLSELAGGDLEDAENRKTAKSIWSHSAKWCLYEGQVAEPTVGVAVFCHPDNFRGSWFHARDYGLLVANPFGRAAMRKGKPSEIVVPAGDSLRLRYGVLVYEGLDRQAIDSAFQEYLALNGTREERSEGR